MKTIHLVDMDRERLTYGMRVQVRLPYCKYSRRQAGSYRGLIQYVKGDHVGIYVPMKGRDGADGFLVGSARVDENGTWIEGR
ncbi:hypothetical protein [Streptomyces antarcticus]|uniref:hypothetical protein n=1 Tax=Streptomyces antarcticus TaxID=2996458 RepID=UPI00226DC07F|nr:hypothetical protein [Streptomyces sp. H34-AA3]MCY0943476.1 hypothetical protein [Streptomyces sp. H34-AA3]